MNVVAPAIVSRLSVVRFSSKRKRRSRKEPWGLGPQLCSSGRSFRGAPGAGRRDANATGAERKTRLRAARGALRDRRAATARIGPASALRSNGRTSSGSAWMRRGRARDRGRRDRKPRRARAGLAARPAGGLDGLAPRLGAARAAASTGRSASSRASRRSSGRWPRARSSGRSASSPSGRRRRAVTAAARAVPAPGPAGDVRRAARRAGAASRRMPTLRSAS